jgi:AcrR family transcriptional regulator
MGSKVRREREKENMRSSIFEAAIKIITDEGYDKLTMRKIADAIEYTPTTIYSYYKNKAEIIDDIARQIYNKIVAAAKNALEEKQNSLSDEKLKAALKAFLYSITDCAEMGNAVIRSGTGAIWGPDDKDEPPEDNGILILQNLLIQGQKESVFRKLDENISWMIITAIIGFSINAIDNKLYLSENWHDLVEVYVDMLVSGLAQKES